MNLLIKQLLLKHVDDLDSGNSKLNFDQLCKILKIMSNINIGYDFDPEDQEMSKSAAAEYIGVSRATFDNYVRDGFIPKGRKVGKFKELRWYKCDLDLFLLNL